MAYTAEQQRADEAYEPCTPPARRQERRALAHQHAQGHLPKNLVHIKRPGLLRLLKPAMHANRAAVETPRRCARRAQPARRSGRHALAQCDAHAHPPCPKPIHAHFGLRPHHPCCQTLLTRSERGKSGGPRDDPHKPVSTCGEVESNRRAHDPHRISPREPECPVAGSIRAAPSLIGGRREP